jgi:hypothetical protein
MAGGYAPSSAIERHSAVSGIPACEEMKSRSSCDVAVSGFAGETQVMTQWGTKRIGELATHSHRLLTERGMWVTAQARSFGVQKLMSVTLSRNGVLKIIHATADNRWILSPLQRSFTLRKVTRDLRPKDRLTPAFPAKAVGLSLDAEGIARGFVFGDGAVSSPNRACANFCGVKDMHLLPVFARRFGLPPRKYRTHIRINGLPA